MRYEIHTGVQQKKVNMKKLVVGGIASLATVGVLAAPTFAAQPVNPGCFGTDRAAVLHGMQDGTSPYSTGAPGASEWGKIASDRAGTNGAINQAYKTSCGGDPTQ